MPAEVQAGRGKTKRKRRPKELAVIHPEGCSGCEACIDFCPVDCIDLEPGEDFDSVNPIAVVDIDRCIGCRLCYLYCPWDTIEMVDTTEMEEAA